MLVFAVLATPSVAASRPRLRRGEAFIDTRNRTDFHIKLQTDAPAPALAASVSREHRASDSGADRLEKRAMAWPENASCAAGLLSHEWHEDTGASLTLQPNPRCANSRLLDNDHSPLRLSSKAGEGPVLTLGFIYYCNGADLARHTSAWSAWPVRERKRLFFVIVDDGSPPGNEAASAVSADMRTRLHIAIVRIEQDLAWNIGGARNLLVAMAPTEHVLLMDMDLRVPEKLAAQLHTLVPKMTALEHASEMGHVFLHFPRIVHWKHDSTQNSRSAHPAVMMLRKASYWLAGGCDEDFVGEYGVTDPHFRYRASRTKGLRVYSMFNLTVPMEQILGSYSCKKPPKNRTRNILLFEAKKAKRVRWATELLRFSWHVAAHAHSLPAAALLSDAGATGATGRIYRARGELPKHRHAANITWYASGRSPAEISDIIYFATIFSSPYQAWRDANSSTLVSQTSLLSLASVPNLNGKLTIVTHSSYNGLPALANIISPIVRLHVLNDDEVDFDTRPANWVLRVELMKYHFVRRQAPGAKVVYVELDQLFLPGAGRLFEATFDNHAFDAAFTFTPRCTKFGCVNTGVVLFRAGPKASLLLDLASKKTLSITGDHSKGGENQRAIGSFFPHLNVTTNETYTNPELNFTIHSVLGGFGGPLNFNSAGCCHLPSAVVVAHFKSMKKKWSRDECCRDRVAVNPGAWRATCSCTQNRSAPYPVCKSIGAKQTTGWCEA